MEDENIAEKMKTFLTLLGSQSQDDLKWHKHKSIVSTAAEKIGISVSSF